MRITLLAASLFASVTSLPAQTFVVDAGNGPGTHFTNLETAVAAVPDGATLIVRAGAYGPIHLQGKGLTIVGGPGVMLNSLFAPAIDVSDLAAHQSFALRGAFMGWAFFGGQVRFANNAGRVLLQDFTYAHNTSPVLGSSGSGLPSGVLVQNCAQVALHGCSIFASNAVDAASSSVDLEGCTLRGSGSTTIIYHNPVFAGTPALVLTNCTARVASCTMFGGPGVHPSVPPAAAIDLRSATLSLGGNTSATSGSPIGFTVAVTTVIGSGVLRRDPLVTLVPYGGAAPVAATLAESLQPWPAVVGTGGQLGLPSSAIVRGAEGELAMLLFSLPGPAFTLPELTGSGWLDLGPLQLLALGRQSVAAPVAYTVITPPDAQLVGRPRAWQAVTWSPAFGLQASNVSMFVLQP